MIFNIVYKLDSIVIFLYFFVKYSIISIIEKFLRFKCEIYNNNFLCILNELIVEFDGIELFVIKC